MSRTLDIPFVRQHFPMYHEPQNFSGHFFDSAAGSFPCTDTIDALADSTATINYSQVILSHPVMRVWKKCSIASTVGLTRWACKLMK